LEISQIRLRAPKVGELKPLKMVIRSTAMVAMWWTTWILKFRWERLTVGS